jgi:hypothetical protein
MDVRTKAQEQNQDLEHGLHVKLSDDELVRQFTPSEKGKPDS